MSENAPAQVLTGQLIGMTGKADTAEVTVWLALRTAAGESTTLESTTDEHGRFCFDLPTQPLRTARVGALLDGVQSVDLDPQGRMLEPGEIVLAVDDIIPSHLRFGGF